MAKRPEKRRLNIEEACEIRDQLDILLRRNDYTYLGQLASKALALYNLYIEHILEGGEVIFRYSDGKEEKLWI